MALLSATGVAGRGAPMSAGTSFHHPFGLLPRDRRRAIEHVHAFCRQIDDLVGEGLAPREAQAELMLLRHELERCYEGVPTRPVTQALQGSIRRFRIPRDPFEAILEGAETDIHKQRYADFTELRGYCVRVASAVGLLCLPILGCTQPRSRDYAVDLGIALQLTNILRDLGADAARGRIYLPADEMETFGYGERELLAAERTPAFLALMRYQAARASRHFESATAALPAADRRRLLPAEVMGAIHRRLLARLETERFPVFERRVSVPRLTQLSLVLRAWATGRVGT